MTEATSLRIMHRRLLPAPLPHPSCPISSKDDNEIRSIKMYSTPCGEAEQ